jgi:hypothetical protein
MSGSFAWEPRKRPDGKDTGPYPGLAAFGEFDAASSSAARPRLLVIMAASGAGRSSFLKAGLWPRLKRDSVRAALPPAPGTGHPDRA